MTRLTNAVRPSWRGSLADRRATRWAAGVAVAVAAVAIPFNASPYTNLQLTLVIALAVAIRGIDVLTGYAGQVTLGQSAFFGIGAYVGAYGFAHGWPVVGGFLLASILCAVAGVIVAIPAVRLRGFAFGVITLALPVVAVPLAIRLEGLTGGAIGLAVSTISAPSWSGLADDQWQYLLVLAIGAAMFLLARNLLAGRVGRALTLIRTSEIAASSVGIPVQRYKILAFAIASAYGGVAGWLYLIAVRYIGVDSLALTLSISMLVALVVGGVRSPLGCVIGAAFYILVPNITDRATPGRSALFFGVALLIVLLMVPGGISGALRAAWSRLIVARRPVESIPAAPAEQRVIA
ncbi:branched-chain amino acid ABC transporter permease [Streptosporangium sp. CA-135522]|uniref:branched-chain amino acid ABC transporter permease n=1 Tax=Streptosporangium sp. CA-135522 TaxID=3240072 RepID=UPI003D8E3EAF